MKTDYLIKIKHKGKSVLCKYTPKPKFLEFFENISSTISLVERPDPDNTFKDNIATTISLVERPDPDNTFRDNIATTISLVERPDPDNTFKDSMKQSTTKDS